MAVKRRDARNKFVIRQLPFRQDMDQNVEVIGHDHVGVDLNSAECRHSAHLVDNVVFVIVVESEGPVHAAAADMVEAFTVILQS